MNIILSFNFFRSAEDQVLHESILAITGLRPGNLQVYKLAASHRSIAKQNAKGYKESNERLEYLGDAILGAVVAEFLFKKYPLRDEGFLTEIRSRIVNRDSLNQVARKMGIERIMEYSENRKNRLAYKSIYGDTLEAIIGAIYLDRGFRKAKSFILRKLLKQHFDLDSIISNNPNHKSKVIEWAHRNNKNISFEITEAKGNSHNREFHAELSIEGESMAKGYGFSKKRAEQDAAQKTCEKLDI